MTNLKWVEEYQCPGCIIGSDTDCYKKGRYEECEDHIAGTSILGFGKIFLGLERGFNKLGVYNDFKLSIMNNIKEWEYDDLNVPVWKKLNKNGHTLVRGLSPRINLPFLHIYLEDCMDKINCIDIDTSEMD